MLVGRQFFVVIAVLAAWPAIGEPAPRKADDHPPDATARADGSAAERILETIEEPALQELASEVLERNPGVAAATARARAAAQRAPQMRALPDPIASLTAFLETPETRTGPQRLAAGVFQGLPWRGKLALKEQAALLEAAALEAEVEVERLSLVTETRRLAYELGFLDRYKEITDEFHTHLLQHEEISRARYSTGVGPGQGVVKLQAEITRIEKRLLEIETRRVALVAQLNALRERGASSPLPQRPLPEAAEVDLDHEVLVETALRFRPELVVADARISRAGTLIELAEKGYRPDFKLGLVYTAVDPREDLPGRLQPPEDNGDDILGIQGGITLPLWRKRLAAGVEEAVELETAAEESKRNLVAAIDAAVGDLTQRVPLDWRQLRLVEDLLIVQAEEALELAEAGYIAGTLNALDLLDAEHVLFEARTAVARAQADYLIGVAKLEGVLGAPLPTTPKERFES